MALRRSQWALVVVGVLALAAAGAYWLAGAEQKPVAEKTLPPKTSAPEAPAASVAPAAPVAPADQKLVTGLPPISISPAPLVNPGAAPPQQ
jgi:hypothetical protein